MKHLFTVLILVIFCAGNNAHSQSPVAKTAVKLVFQKIDSPQDIVRQYPVLKELLSDIEDTDVYRAKTKIGSTSLLFIRLEGILYRGTEGTPLTVFMDTGSGYKQVLDVTTQSDITISDKSPPVIFLRSKTGKTTAWEYDLRAGQYRPRKI